MLRWDIAHGQKGAETPDLADTTQSSSTSITLKDDNQWSIALGNNPMLHTRMKHIDIQDHCIQDEVTSRKINLLWVNISGRANKTCFRGEFH